MAQNGKNTLAGAQARHAVAWVAGMALLAGAAVFFVDHPAAAGEKAVKIPAPAIDEQSAGAHTETAVFAGGCFWGVQGVFQHVKGVTQAVSGYAGGNASNANYETVSTGITGHAESVKVTYDPSVVSYGKLLQVYFSVAHDPTQRNRQGPDVGSQYRSTVFAASDVQEKVAAAYIKQLNDADAYGRPLATTIESLKAFYPAESYHQDYLTHHPDSLYIAVNDLPKVESLERMFPALYREKPVLVGG
ncbi:peptide-methionine (S)-S-oxide reductase [Allopusillimonas soli]|uniref:Peptide methionine sulfoxide reductase MsrA n=1 Tax=Allopusillimonas soli TaxID=659016 RepID=A0A853FGI7_9BURK|nr:peptide-methionine (S)-S-oxide reductase MsrA [Allopusillimonas soli]TEA69562.1 peptide-methionine (S)-S-oxide reductase [Allopusillimonas soli]